MQRLLELRRICHQSIGIVCQNSSRFTTFFYLFLFLRLRLSPTLILSSFSSLTIPHQSSPEDKIYLEDGYSNQTRSHSREVLHTLAQDLDAPSRSRHGR